MEGGDRARGAFQLADSIQHNLGPIADPVVFLWKAVW